MIDILIFIAVLFVLILVHEWGHFIVAKKTGMRVDEFGIGFPPRITGVKKGETEYTLNWLPIGGFVKIWGENGEDGLPSESEVPSETDSGDSKKADKGRAFSERPKWAQALVLVAGVTMNVLFAWIMFSAALMIGVPTPVEDAVATDRAELIIADVLPESPAKSIPLGSVVTGISNDEESITRPNRAEFTEFVQNTAPEPVLVDYRYGGEEFTAELTPAQGLSADDPERYLLGVSLMLAETEAVSPPAALYEGARSTYYGLVAVAGGLWSLLHNAIVGSADLSQVSGPVGIVGMVGDAVDHGATTLLVFTAIISLNLAVINLLPFPALDGGRLVFVAIEAITGRRIPPVWAGRVNLVGFAILMILMVVVTFNDVTKLL